MAIDVRFAHEICRRHNANNASRRVHHRQRLNVAFSEQLPRGLQLGAVADSHQLARHDVAATNVGQLSLICVQLNVFQHRFQIVTTDVKHLVVARKHCVEIRINRSLVCVTTRYFDGGR